MEPKISKERFFSAELQSKSDLKSVTIHDGTAKTFWSRAQSAS
jgi:hypothetical protein